MGNQVFKSLEINQVNYQNQNFYKFLRKEEFINRKEEEETKQDTK